MKKLKSIVILFCVLVLISGCKSLTDVIQSFDQEIEKVYLSVTERNMYIGEILTLSASVAPYGAPASITWTTSDNDVAIISNGQVEAAGLGKAVIKAISDDEEKYAECVINVIEPGMAVISGSINSVISNAIIYNKLDTSFRLENYLRSDIFYTDKNGYKRTATSYLNNNNYFSFIVPLETEFVITFTEILTNNNIASLVIEGDNTFKLSESTNLRTIKIEDTVAEMENVITSNLVFMGDSDMSSLNAEVTYDERPEKFELINYLAAGDAKYIVRANTFFGSTPSPSVEWNSNHSQLDEYIKEADGNIRVAKYRISPDDNYVEFVESEYLYLENGMYKAKNEANEQGFIYQNYIDKGIKYVYQLYNFLTDTKTSEKEFRVVASFATKSYPDLGDIGPGIIYKIYDNDILTFNWAVKGLGIISTYSCYSDRDDVVPRNIDNTSISYIETDSTSYGSKPGWFDNVVLNLPESSSIY
ncbi:Ig domain-containing protein [Candidatus Margulisiibacteriota bacterium]